MITFDEIKSHLSQKIDRLAQFVQIEERQNFFIIEYEKTKQCFITGLPR